MSLFEIFQSNPEKDKKSNFEGELWYDTMELITPEFAKFIDKISNFFGGESALRKFLNFFGLTDEDENNNQNDTTEIKPLAISELLRYKPSREILKNTQEYIISEKIDLEFKKWEERNNGNKEIQNRYNKRQSERIDNFYTKNSIIQKLKPDLQNANAHWQPSRPIMVTRHLTAYIITPLSKNEPIDINNPNTYHLFSAKIKLGSGRNGEHFGDGQNSHKTPTGNLYVKTGPNERIDREISHKRPVTTLAVHSYSRNDNDPDGPYQRLVRVHGTQNLNTMGTFNSNGCIIPDDQTQLLITGLTEEYGLMNIFVNPEQLPKTIDNGKFQNGDYSFEQPPKTRKTETKTINNKATLIINDHPEISNPAEITINMHGAGGHGAPGAANQARYFKESIQYAKDAQAKGPILYPHFSHSLKDAEMMAYLKEVQKLYPKSKINFTFHSYGGTILCENNLNNPEFKQFVIKNKCGIYGLDPVIGRGAAENLLELSKHNVPIGILYGYVTTANHTLNNVNWLLKSLPAHGQIKNSKGQIIGYHSDHPPIHIEPLTKRTSDNQISAFNNHHTVKSGYAYIMKATDNQTG